MEVAALTPCNHTTCHKCTFRQRSLYEKSTCLICRTENDKIIITEQIHKDFGDITDKDIVATNDKYNIEFTSKLAEHETLKLLENICCICHETFPDFKPLIDHAKEVHNKFYCLICSKFKKHSNWNYLCLLINNCKNIKLKEMETNLDLQDTLIVNIVKVKDFILKMN